MSLYGSFFGLEQAPFSIAPDPRYLFMSERHREALAHLLYGLDGGGGFVLLTGEIGTGKTTVCRCFLEQIPAQCDVAYIFNPKLTVVELLQSVCDELHISVPGRDHPPTVKDYIDPLNRFLLQAHASGRNSVLIIDEAQNLSAEVLEQLRLLTNLETRERKLLQIVLIGQPELRTLLASPQLEQLAQRVIARYHLDALTPQESAQYIQHRLDVAGLNRPLPFERSALRLIHALSGGVPRRINLLCDRALLGAYAQGRALVDAPTVRKAAAEVFDTPSRRRWSWGLRAALGVVALGAAGLAGMVWQGERAGEPVAARTAGLAARAPAASGAPALLPSAPAALAGATTASGAPTAASATAPAQVPAQVTATGAGADSASRADGGMAALHADRAAATRELGRLWGLPTGADDPCAVGPGWPVQCFSRPLSLATIRQLARPGVLRLEAAGGPAGYVLLVALGPDSATLRVAGAERVISVTELAQRWRGDYLTLWRTPPGWNPRRAELQGGEALDWAASHLPPGPAAAGASAPASSLAPRVRIFQLAQGLGADGLLGPLTWMQLNRVAGIDEPRLRIGR